MAKKEKANTRFANNGLVYKIKCRLENFSEDNRFGDILRRFENKEFLGIHILNVGRTPLVLGFGGCDVDLDMVISPNTIVKCRSKPSERHHGHDLSGKIFKKILHELRNPVMVLKGSRPNTLVAVSSLKDKEQRPIIITVSLGYNFGHSKVNKITSAYGRNNFGDYISRQIDDGKLIAVNKNKANKLLRSFGVPFPIEETFISFDNSIAYSDKNVNSFLSKYFENDDIPLDSVEFEAFEEKDKFSCLIDEINQTLSLKVDLMDMIRFFEYAGDEICQSMLWHEFQQEKHLGIHTDLEDDLKNVLVDAKERVGSGEKVFLNEHTKDDI